jgi:putative PIN family toxin of toxin-antitoxin system
MRAALDTNALVRAARQDSPARALLDLLIEPPHVLPTSAFILDELARAMRYPRLRRIHGLDDAEIDRHVQDLQTTASIDDLAVSPIPTVVASDPQDDPIVATGIRGQADILVTLDSDLRRADVRAYCAQFNVRIMTDVEALEELRRANLGSS